MASYKTLGETFQDGTGTLSFQPAADKGWWFKYARAGGSRSVTVRVSVDTTVTATVDDIPGTDNTTETTISFHVTDEDRLDLVESVQLGSSEQCAIVLLGSEMDI